LTHLPINHEDMCLVLRLEILIRNQNAVAMISTFSVSRVSISMISHFPVQKSPCMTCNLLSSSSSSFAFAMTS
jgi:hypothetical protein